ncbi:MAG: hypothetical protein WBP41_00495, partial [Saprospiraceae bacterium]
MLTFIIFICSGLTFLFLVLSILSWNQNQSVKLLLRDIGIERENTIPVQFTLLSSYQTKLPRIFGPGEAEMILGDNFFIVVPSKNALFSVFHMPNLPMLFTNNAIALKSKSKHGNIVQPSEILVSKSNNIILK